MVMRPDRLRALARLAKLLRGAELARLGRASAALEEVRARLAAHDAGGGGDVSPDIGALQAAAAHRQWRMARRAGINTALAARTADWLDARDRAALAVGRDAVLARLRSRQRTRG